MNVAVICIGLLGLLLVGSGFMVSMTRGRTKVNIGCPSDPTDPLHKVVRAHGNTTEYAPMLAILMLVVAMRSPATWALWCIALATLSRYLIVAGLLMCKSLEDAHPLRFVGALGTYVTGFGLCVALLLSL